MNEIPQHTSQKFGTNVLKLGFTVRSGNTIPIFICSDIHLDNTCCDRELFKKDLDKAKDRGSLIFIIGDLFDLMQGKFDPRSNKSALSGRHKSEDYLMDVIQDGKEFLLPYKDNLVMISCGNHESSVHRRVEINPLALLCEFLRAEGSNVTYMPYQGWVILGFAMPGASKKINGDSKMLTTRRIFYTHGNFHGQVSLGTQAIRRYAAVAANADIFISGDNHERWTAGHSIYDICPRTGEQYIFQQIHIKTGTYKNEFLTGSGFAAERLAMPKSLGGTFMDISTKISKGEINLEYDIINNFLSKR